MANYNTSSENIQVFPTAGRPEKDPLGRLTTEYNLTSILNRLLDRDGFVITQNNGAISLEKNTSYDFEFNIHGYLFHIDNLGDVIDGVTHDNNSNQINVSEGYQIYAKIKIATPTAGEESGGTSIPPYKLQYIDGSDNKDNGRYTGLDFYLTDENGSPIEINSTSTTISGTATTTTNIYELSLLTYKDKNWYISEESKIKFETSESGLHRSVKIDDGVLGEIDSGVLDS